MDQNSLLWIYFVGNTYNWVYIWWCKYGENRYYERCANKKWCASEHTGLLNSCLGKLYLLPYLTVTLISARITLISTGVSAHCHAILFCKRFTQFSLCSHINTPHLYIFVPSFIVSPNSTGLMFCLPLMQQKNKVCLLSSYLAIIIWLWYVLY